MIDTEQNKKKLNSIKVLLLKNGVGRNVLKYCRNHLFYCFDLNTLKIMFPLRAFTTIYKGF